MVPCRWPCSSVGGAFKFQKRRGEEGGSVDFGKRVALSAMDEHLNWWNQTGLEKIIFKEFSPIFGSPFPTNWFKVLRFSVGFMSATRLNTSLKEHTIFRTRPNQNRTRMYPVKIPSLLLLLGRLLLLPFNIGSSFPLNASPLSSSVLPTTLHNFHLFSS
ncbi:hypothetical protein LXL04_013224 [Taraxacum kok-saghyz]